jgi:hypothetical protein
MDGTAKRHPKPPTFLSEVPALPTDPKDIFVAFEFEVDDQNNFSNVVPRLPRQRRSRKGCAGDVQELLLRKSR